MTRLRSAIALMLTAAWPSNAIASETKANDQIVVTGKTADEVREEAKQFVKEVGHPSGNLQAARWVDAVCPTAIGVSNDLKSIVESRVREVAKSIGARVAKPNCSSNLAIVFTTSAEARKIVSGYTLRAGTSGENVLPVRWWYAAEAQGRNGHKISPVPPASLPTNMPLPMFAPDFNPVFEPGRFESSTRRVIQRAFVLVDLDQVNGKRLNSLIDYAAFVGLSEVRLGAAPDGSILSLFGGGEPTTHLTQNDVTYLKTLYSMPMNRSQRQQRGTFANGMTKGRGQTDLTQPE